MSHRVHALSQHVAKRRVFAAGAKTEKVLVANRGEIACRIFRVCKRLGMKTVGIFTEEDKESNH